MRILDSFEDGGSSYIVMEYMEGRTLKEALRERSFFPAEELSAKMLPLIHTLGKIHRAGVIHRDISPDNIMELPDGSLKLFDFGAAKNYGEQEGASSVIVKGAMPRRSSTRPMESRGLGRMCMACAPRCTPAWPGGSRRMPSPGAGR